MSEVKKWMRDAVDGIMLHLQICDHDCTPPKASDILTEIATHAPDESALLRECRDAMLEAQRMFALLHSHFGWEWPEHNTSTMKVAGQIDTALARLDEVA